MKHVDADQLRAYQFNLLDPASRAEIAAHLETCDACRAALDGIQRQFAALDALKDQPEVSEARLEAVLVESRKVEGRRSKVIPFRPIIALAAASLAIVFMLAWPNNRTAGVPPAPPQSPRTADRSSERTARRAIPTLAELRAEQPFAPASNIELNVLPRRDEVQLTIYNATDLTLVREKRKMTLKRGWNWLQFMWANTLIDPTSLELTPVTHAGQIEITQLVYPPRLNQLARWTIFSEFSGEAEFELTYLTSGLKWNATYEATLAPDEQTMRLKSHVRVDNHSGEDYANAQTRLVVGEVNLIDSIRENARRTPAYGSPRELFGGDPFGRHSPSPAQTPQPRLEDTILIRFLPTGFVPMKPKKIDQEGLSEYQLLTIAGRETIPHGWGKRLPHFNADDIPVKNVYQCDLPKNGVAELTRTLSFTNSTTHQLGNLPLPEGSHLVYRDRANGDRSFIAYDHVNYAPKGAAVVLDLGVATKVLVHSTLIKTETLHHEFDVKGNLSGWTKKNTYRVRATNSRDIPITVKMKRIIDEVPPEVRASNLLKSVMIQKLDFRGAKLDDVLIALAGEVEKHNELHHDTLNIRFESMNVDNGQHDAHTVSLHGIPLLDALGYLTELASMTWDILPSAAMIRGADQWTVEQHGNIVMLEKLDLNHVEFKLDLPPKSKKEFTYTVTIEHGTRAE